MRYRNILAAFAALTISAALGAQTTTEEFSARHQRQVARVGYAGLGVEGIIDKWEAAFPEDGKMLRARFSYYLAKGMRTEAVRKDGRKFLGADPMFSIPDSTGVPVNFFEEQFFDDELFAQALTTIDKAIALYPDEMIYRINRISALLAYEKETPDLALNDLNGLIARQKAEKPEWTFNGEAAAKDDFSLIISEYCVKLFTVGTPSAYEAFYSVSCQMNALYPKDPTYLDNIGSYWLVAKQKDKKAAGFYKKALKLDPEDEAAQKNLKLIERRKAAAKNAKKKK